MKAAVFLILLSLLNCFQSLQKENRNLQGSGECLISEVALANGSCFKCGTTGSRTKSRKNATECSCISNSYSWNSVDGLCDCGPNMAMLVNGTKYSCLKCDEKINSFGKKDWQTCLCIQDELVWNSTLKRCECPYGDQLGQIYSKGNCIQCGFGNKLSSGISLKRPGECDCYFKATVWSPDQQMCVCSKPNAVFNLDLKLLIEQNKFDQNTLRCQLCDSKLNALATDRINVYTCACPEGLIWIPLLGCYCPGGQVLIPGVRPKCISCNQTKYALGVSVSAEGCSCICTEGLKWNAKIGKCVCSKVTEVPIKMSDGNYTCNQCRNSEKFTALPVIGGENCSCLYKNLVWNQNSGACTCPNASIQVFVSSPSVSCIKCDESINAEGIDQGNFNKCKCASGLIFQSGFCDCGKIQAYYKHENGSFTCINCNNTGRYLKNRKSPSECNCLSSNLNWNSSLGACLCPNNNVPYGKGSTFKCTTCSGRYIVANTLSENDLFKCKCSLNQMNFTITNSGVSYCSCPENNSIITLKDPACQVCVLNVSAGSSGSIISVFECKCVTSYFWSYSQKKCKACSEDGNAKLTGGSNLHCACQANFIWDVITQTCIVPCAQKDQSCLICSSDPNSDGSVAVLASSVPASTRASFQGGQTIKMLIGVGATNYFQLSKYQCICKEGFAWDSLRLRCISTLLK